MLHIILKFDLLLWFIINNCVSDRLTVERSVCWRVSPKSVGPIICPPCAISYKSFPRPNNFISFHCCLFIPLLNLSITQEGFTKIKQWYKNSTREDWQPSTPKNILETSIALWRRAGVNFLFTCMLLSEPTCSKNYRIRVEKCTKLHQSKYGAVFLRQFKVIFGAPTMHNSLPFVEL